MNQNLATKLVETASKLPDQTALIAETARLSYGELDRLSSAFAADLITRGIEPGEPVGLMLPNVPEFAIAYYAILKAGAIVVPMNMLLKRREVAFYLRDPGARLLLASGAFIEEARAGAADADAECLDITDGLLGTLALDADHGQPAKRAAADTAVILYTSGTTGAPKGAELTHSNLRKNVDVCVETLLEIGPDDIVLGALPLFHSFGQTCGLNSAVAAGSALALVPRFDPTTVLETIENNGITVFEGVPTMYSALLGVDGRKAYDVSTLRCCVSGGAALPVEVLRSFEAEFGCIVLEGYGLSETSPVACFNHPHSDRLPGSIGTPIAGVEMRIVGSDRRAVPQGEAGEIAIRGHNVMKGYLNQPEATAEAIDPDGWFYTGDIGRTDEDGRYFIVDRKKDLVIRGGYNVYPREIEEVLYEHPAVREAAVIGLPHAELGEEVAAVVAVVPNSDVTPVQLREYVRERVAAYKYPRHVWFVDDLPKGATGKILKREIEIPDALLASVGGES